MHINTMVIKIFKDKYLSVFKEIFNITKETSIKDLISFIVISILLLSVIWFSFILFIIAISYIPGLAAYTYGYGFAGVILIPIVFLIIHIIPLLSLFLRIIIGILRK